MNLAPEPLRLQANYQQTYAALGAAALILGIATAAILLLAGGDPQALLALFATLGSFWLIMVLVIGFNDWRHVRRERHDAEALINGEQWAQWQWSPAEWRREIEEQRVQLEKWTRFQRKWMPIMTGVAALVVSGTLVAIVLIAGEDAPANVRSFMFGLAVALALLIIMLSVFAIWRERRKRERLIERAEQVMAPRIRFGPYGYYHDVYGHTSLRALQTATFSVSRGVLAFQLRYTRPRGGSMVHPTSITVPEAHLDEASALAQRYRRAT